MEENNHSYINNIQKEIEECEYDEDLIKINQMLKDVNNKKEEGNKLISN